MLCVGVACKPDSEGDAVTPEAQGNAGTAAGASSSAQPSAKQASKPSVAEEVLTDAAPSQPPARCPEGMQLIRGGPFTMGAARGRGAKEDHPRYDTRIGDYCLDATEVTVAKYTECVEKGECTQPHGSQRTCNYGHAGRALHPINCIDWDQARAYCETQHKRLPKEVEWEYAARGGAQRTRYSWGSEAPEGRTCWKSNRSCPVAQFEAGAFGLFDMTGNVWEWTADWFGRFPWPPASGRLKGYRGGSWSRRFDKWMRADLRNRAKPSDWGSHLGVRCAADLPGAECPYGRDSNGSCLHGVDAVQCADPDEAFNGQRCARPGEPTCRPGWSIVAGHGCEPPPDSGTSVGKASSPPPPSDIARSPEFDADCRQYQPQRPVAYRFEGGSHLGRNRAGRKRGCKNRDVGVGWNSACCPK